MIICSSSFILSFLAIARGRLFLNMRVQSPTLSCMQQRSQVHFAHIECVIERFLREEKKQEGCLLFKSFGREHKLRVPLLLSKFFFL